MIRPNEEQYIKTIREGDDSRNKNILLNFDGKFEIAYDFDITSRGNYVGRSETLDAYNGYVGIKASEDIKYISQSYSMFLSAWIRYKKDNNIGQYLDIYDAYSREKVAELESLIDQIPQ